MIARAHKRTRVKREEDQVPSPTMGNATPGSKSMVGTRAIVPASSRLKDKIVDIIEEGPVDVCLSVVCVFVCVWMRWWAMWTNG